MKEILNSKAHVSLHFALLNLKFSKPPRRTPQTFSVTAAVAAPALVIFLNSALIEADRTRQTIPLALIKRRPN